MFWASRISVCKGLFDKAPAAVAEVIVREYGHRPLSDMIAGFLRHNPERLRQIDLEDETLTKPAHRFLEWIRSGASAANQLSDYLTSTSEAFDVYWSDLVQDAEQIVLIDSGWQGTAQSLLKASYPNQALSGLYFGRILTADSDQSIVPEVIGLVFEENTYAPSRPASALTLHRHVVESLLEPNAPSVEDIPAGEFSPLAAPFIDALRNEEIDPIKDALYSHVRAYLDDHRTLTLSQVEARYAKAIQELAQALTCPTAAEAVALAGKDRSADFGKTYKVPVLLPEDHPHHRTKSARIAASLWPSGQAALELAPSDAKAYQRQLIGLDAGLSPNAKRSFRASPDLTSKDTTMADSAQVAIITRTKDRPLLLRRAAESVASQTYADYLWIVVNDGGDPQAVEAILEACPVDRRKLRLITNETSLGMEAASNIGVRACASTFVVIHDDDDSWDPTFLDKTVAYLTSQSGARYGGVVTGTLKISEEMTGDAVVERGAEPYNPWLTNIQIAELMAENAFAPISFLFRRSLYDQVGGFVEDLPVLGDWLFNLEALLYQDIAVLPEQLARYHHRDVGAPSAAGVYGNTVVSGRDKHLEYASVVRNSFIRRNMNKPAVAGAITGYFAQDLRRRMDKVSAQIHANASDALLSTLVRLDRAYVISFVNQRIAEQAAAGQPIGTPLPANSDWDDIFAALDVLKEDVPPPDYFSEEGYKSLNPDVGAAIDDGAIQFGFNHYIRNGRLEGRRRPIPE